MLNSPCWLPATPESVEPTLAAWVAKHPDMGVLVLLPESERSFVGDLQALCARLDVPLIGAIFPALVVNDAFPKSGMWAICLDVMPDWALFENISTTSSLAAVEIARTFDPLVGDTGSVRSNARVLFTLFDGMIPNIGSIMTSLFGRMGDRIRYAGVNAGSETFQPMPCLFTQEKCVSNAVLAILLPEEFAVVARHGYPAAACKKMVATSTTGNRIATIDGRPAFEVYQQIVSESFGVQLTHENFYEYAVHYPFGLVLVTDSVVRIPVGFTEEGALICVGEIPPNSILRLLHAPTLEESNCAEEVATAVTELGGVVGRPLLTFYCAGRRMHLGASAEAELSQIQSALGASNLFGALSLGEIGCDMELRLPRFLNAAVLCLVETA